MKRRTLKTYDPDCRLTEHEAVEYARVKHGFELPVSRLQRSRIGLCQGPKCLKVGGWAVHYTPRFIDEYVETRRTVVIDPAERMAKRGAA